MFRAVKLAAMALSATVALSLPTPAIGQDFTTWLFAEGSTSGVLGFEKELLLANPNNASVQVTISAFTQEGDAIAPFQLPLEPLSRTGVNVRSIPGVGDRAGIALRVTATAPIIAERTMYWGGGQFRGGKIWASAVNDMRGGHNEKGVAAGSYTWYFAEGEGKFFNTFISVANPNNVDTKVRVRYLDDKGTTVTQEDVVPANARRTFWPTAVLSPRFQPGQAGFATIVESVDDNGVGPKQLVVAERQMYWGPGAPFGIRGGHAAMGVTQPATTWMFAEGVQGGTLNFDTYLLLFNQNDTPTTITTKFYADGGVELATDVRTLAPLSRDNVPSSTIAALAGKAFAMEVTATQPIVAERAVYWRGLLEGHATAGANAPAKKWGFAEGLQGGFLMYQDAAHTDKRRFNTFFPIYNPGATDAVVTVYFYTEGANTGVTKTVNVPARSRATVWPLLYPELANEKFATFFSSTEPLVIERVVYWGNGFTAGHASLGTALPDAFPLYAPSAAPPAPGPTLTVTPNRGVPGGGTVVEIEGSEFGHSELGTRVLFGGKEAVSFEVEHDNLIRAVTPPGSTGKVDVTVETNGQTIVAPLAFEYFDKNAAWAPISYGDQYGLVESVAAARPFDLSFSCVEHGSPNSNTFMFEVVVALRKKYQTNRWGLNWKRGNVGDLSQDIVNYYGGPEGGNMRNSTAVRIYDIIGGHCGSRPGPFWVDQTSATAAAGAIGRWTVDPMCGIARYRDAKFDNGEWMFPECR